MSLGFRMLFNLWNLAFVLFGVSWMLPSRLSNYHSVVIKDSWKKQWIFWRLAPLCLMDIYGKSRIEDILSGVWSWCWNLFLIICLIRTSIVTWPPLLILSTFLAGVKVFLSFAFSNLCINPVCLDYDSFFVRCIW